ncbi:MAG TPA: type II toxin-antitoxin system VapC family toxin [Chloroflexota bacterium]|nr:type II toxin-antitoxin system VapC family toxin [Chloroflexota bacterium]
MIDASACVWSILPALASVDVRQRFGQWRETGVRLVSPTLWLPECVSAVRSAVHGGVLRRRDADDALENLFDLDVELEEVDRPLCRAAFGWADRLGQRRAYDAFYVALAERLATELWTADRRLANAASREGAPWVRWIGAV